MALAHSRLGSVTYVDLQNVCFAYQQGAERLQAVENVDVQVSRGQFVAIVGPSGCGKSTILRLIAGLLRVDSGRILVNGAAPDPRRVRVGMVQQASTLLPWLSVRDNVMLSLKIARPFRHDYRAKRLSEFRDRVDRLLSKVDLAGFADAFPWQLSGGMMQRAVVCRALVHEPQLILLDEPFGALDQFTREEIWQVFQTIWSEHKPAVVMVSHDLREAVYLSDRILIMRSRPGRIVGVHDVPFKHPRTIDLTYSATFFDFVRELRAAIFSANTH